MQIDLLQKLNQNVDYKQTHHLTMPHLIGKHLVLKLLLASILFLHIVPFSTDQLMQNTHQNLGKN